jgi:tRNA U34 5-methylaminomethyl-2-thiouridine-forming methyltransferase MnmC
MTDDIEVITTKDGSSSLYLPHINETYHSTHGALTESQYIYIDKGINYLVERGETALNIFEVGFGTGLNAILTYIYWNKHSNIKVNYTTIEKFPLSDGVVNQLSFAGITDNDEVSEIFSQLHNLEWSVRKEINKGFTFIKYQQDIESFKGNKHYNIIYYDAFAPSRQPEMWELHILEKVKSLLTPNGVLITYCAQGQFKRNLKQLGFELDSLRGPQGKTEITRAILK